MTATYSRIFDYVDDDGNAVTPAKVQIQVPYKAASIGTIPIADGTPSGTEFDMPFQGMTQGGALILIRNKTGQELNMAWGGNWFPHLAIDGLLSWAAPAPPTSGAVLGLRFMLTKTQQGDGKITFSLFGQ